MIESIYVIDQNSGIPLFVMDLVERDESDKLDKHLFSGFLKAINDLSQETRSETIDEIRMSSSRIVYMNVTINNKALLLISISDLKEKLKTIRRVLQRVAEAFEKEYSAEIAVYNGEISIFQPFSEKAREIIILESGSIKEKRALKQYKHPLKEFIIRFKSDPEKYMLQMKDWIDKQHKKFKKSIVGLVTQDKKIIIKDEDD
ncbi:MAG: hypothetical protein ACTSRG_12230 [Candidatus Helarchaeota archaeon]